MTILIRNFMIVCLATTLFALGLTTIIRNAKQPRHYSAQAAIECQVNSATGCLWKR